MANDEHLQWLVTQIEQIPHVTRLRIHTRLPVVIPQRITSELVSMLTRSRLKPTIVLHINHANEIDDKLAAALIPLIDARIPIFNQSVLLKGVNDDLTSLVNLSEKTFDHGIMPYYLHVLDKVQGASHFDIPESIAVDLIKQLAATLPGYLVPKLVREIAGEPNKTPLSLA
jgi:KamA family protein